MAMHSRSSKTDAPDRAEAVMKRFRELSNQRAVRIKPDEYTYSLLLKTWYDDRSFFECLKSPPMRMMPRLSMFAQFLLIHRITSARPDGIEQAVSRLEWMRTLSDAGDEAALPDIVKVCECECKVIGHPANSNWTLLLTPRLSLRLSSTFRKSTLPLFQPTPETAMSETP